MSAIGRKLVPQSTIERRVQGADDRYARALRRRCPAMFLAPEILPYASVEIVSAELAPVLDVERTIENAQRAGRVEELQRLK